MARTKFFIWCMGRSGSSYLVSLLRSHPEVRCMGERFSLPDGHRRPCFPNEASTKAELDALYASKRQGAAGFKFKYPGQHEVYPDVWRYLCERRSQMRVICLGRRNILKQAISNQNLNQITKRFGSANISASTMAGPSHDFLNPIALDVVKLLPRLRTLSKLRERLRELIGAFPSIHWLSYEQLCAEPERACREVLEFLEVDPTVPLTSPLKKATSDDLRSAIKNYDETCRALESTPYYRFLTSDSELPSPLEEKTKGISSVVA